MASKSRARQTAKSARTGGYQRSEAGKSYQRAVKAMHVQVGKSDITHNQRRFRSLDKAMEFAASLPDSQKSYIVGKGEYNNQAKYANKPEGFAALNGWARGNYYGPYGDDLRDEAERIFKDGAKSYYVRWTDI